MTVFVQGIVAVVKAGFGFINCVEGGRLFFHYNEMLDSNHLVKISDEVEFTVDKNLATVNER